MPVKFEINGEEHQVEVSSLTMGEKWLMARDFDVDWDKVGEEGDIGYGGVLGLLVVALIRTGVPEAQAKTRILAMTDDQIVVKDDPPDPTEAVQNGKSKTPARKTRVASGKSGT